MTADPRAEKRYNHSISDARVSEVYRRDHSVCIRRRGFSACVQNEESCVYLIEPTYCARSLIIRRAFVGFMGPPWVPLLLARRDAYPSLCTEVLNAIMQYKDTIGNSMARVLCLAHTTPSSSRSRQIFFRRERKLINGPYSLSSN